MNDISVFNKSVESEMLLTNYEKSTQLCIINVRYSYVRSLGIGVKFANIHGQKGIVQVVDLSEYKYYTNDGKCVYPQVLFSPISIIGRTVASQVNSMINAKMAISESGNVIAPMAINLHSIENCQKAGTSSGIQKLDLMAVENGILCNNLCSVLPILERQCTVNDRERMLHIISQCFNTENVVIDY